MAARRSQGSGSRAQRSRIDSARARDWSVSPSIKRAHDVDRERIHQRRRSRVPQKSFDPGQIRVPQEAMMRLQQHHGGQAQFEDRLRPQLGTECRDLIM